MNVFPGRALTVPIYFEIGGDPVSPTVASYRVVDSVGTIIVPDTAFTLSPNQTQVYVVIPPEAHTALGSEKFRSLRLEVSFSAEGGIFHKDYVYYVVPDLFLSFSDTNSRLLLGLSEAEFQSITLDYYRAYIDLVTGEIGDDFYAALMGTDVDLATTARNLLLYASLRTVMPIVQTSTFKSIESETSKMTRFDVDFKKISDYLEQQYAFYYAQIKLISTPTISPTFLVLDTPTDAITG